MEKLLTPEEAGQVLGISTGALGQLRYKGTGPKYVRLSPRKIRYTASALEEFVTATTRQGTGVGAR